MPRSSGFRITLALAIAAAAPHPALAQPAHQPPAVTAPEPVVSAEEALKRGEVAYEQQDYPEAMRGFRSLAWRAIRATAMKRFIKERV